MNTLDGTLSPVECLDNPSVCDRSSRCATRMAWGKMKQAKEEVLRNVTVQGLVDYEEKTFVSDYSI